MPSSRFLPATASKNASRATNVNTLSASGSVGQDLSVAWWNPTHTKLFNQWASTFEQLSNNFGNPYFDYFYSGQDVQVTIDGLTDSTDILPIYAFAYNITQQKQPLYGYWSYAYDAMLRGTRIVTGAFSIVATQPYLLTGLIGKAADLRSKTSDVSRYSIRQLDTDETNINQYWKRNFDNNLDVNQQHLFSIHPPFNLIIKYGLQETSAIDIDPSKRANELEAKFGGSSPMMTDINERLVQNPSIADETKIILENIELVSKSVDYNSDGDPILENYTFIARDERLLKRVAYDSTSSGSNNNSSTGGGMSLDLPPEGVPANSVSRDVSIGILPDSAPNTVNTKPPIRIF